MRTKSNLRYNLSYIFQYAHRMFTVEPTSFAERLRRSWELARAYIKAGKATGQFVIFQQSESISYEQGAIRYYEQGTNGKTYFGD